MRQWRTQNDAGRIYKIINPRLSCPQQSGVLSWLPITQENYIIPSSRTLSSIYHRIKPTYDLYLRDPCPGDRCLSRAWTGEGSYPASSDCIYSYLSLFLECVPNRLGQFCGMDLEFGTVMFLVPTWNCPSCFLLLGSVFLEVTPVGIIKGIFKPVVGFPTLLAGSFLISPARRRYHPMVCFAFYTSFRRSFHFKYRDP